VSSDELERLNLASASSTDECIGALQATFPEVFREGKIDFDALRCSVGYWVEPSRGEGECPVNLATRAAGSGDACSRTDPSADGNLNGWRLYRLYRLSRSHRMAAGVSIVLVARMERLRASVAGTCVLVEIARFVG
jgi:hypothetical protein